MKGSTEILIFFANLIKPNNYLEIGVNQAQTLNEIGKIAGSSIGVDPNKDCEKYIENNPCVIFKNMTSDNFFRSSRNDIRFDMVFIDGLHEYAQVKRDFWNVIPRLKSNGWVFIHDTFPPNEKHLSSRYCGDVWKFAEELKRELPGDMYEFITLPWYYGISIVHWREGQIDFEPTGEYS